MARKGKVTQKARSALKKQQSFVRRLKAQGLSHKAALSKWRSAKRTAGSAAAVKLPSAGKVGKSARKSVKAGKVAKGGRKTARSSGSRKAAIKSLTGGPARAGIKRYRSYIKARQAEGHSYRKALSMWRSAKRTAGGAVKVSSPKKGKVSRKTGSKKSGSKKGHKTAGSISKLKAGAKQYRSFMRAQQAKGLSRGKALSLWKKQKKGGKTTPSASRKGGRKGGRRTKATASLLPTGKAARAAASRRRKSSWKRKHVASHSASRRRSRRSRR